MKDWFWLPVEKQDHVKEDGELQRQTSAQARISRRRRCCCRPRATAAAAAITRTRSATRARCSLLTRRLCLAAIGGACHPPGETKSGAKNVPSLLIYPPKIHSACSQPIPLLASWAFVWAVKWAELIDSWNLCEREPLDEEWMESGRGEVTGDFCSSS